MANEFVMKTFHMVEYCTQDHPDIICWNEDGSKFVVTNIDLLEKQIIPLYFESHDHKRFFRQLNYYKFQKTKLDTCISLNQRVFFNIYTFQHGFFRQGQRDLLSRVTRAPLGIKKETEEKVTSLKKGIARLDKKTENLIEELHQKTDCFFSWWQYKYDQLEPLKEKKESREQNNENDKETPKLFIW